MMHKAWCSIEEVPYYWWSSIKFQGHTGWKIYDLNPIWVRLLGLSQLSNPSDLPCLAATKQLYEWYFLSVCLSVHLSHHFDYVPFIVSSWNFQELSPRTRVRSMQKVKVKLNRFRTVTPVWSHIWWWNDTYSLMLLRRGALLFFKVIRQVSRSHGTKNHRIWPRLGVSWL